MRPLAVVVAFALAAPVAYAQQPAPRPRPAPAPRGGASAVAPRPAPAPIPPGIARPPAGGFPRPAPPGAYPHGPRYPYAPYYPHGYHYPYGYYPYGYYPYGYYPYGAFGSSFWWGFDAGWGYYPPYYPPYPVAGVYPAPGAVYPVPVSPAPPPDAFRISTRLEVRGAWQSGGGAGGVAFAIDGRRFGFHTSIDAVSVKAVTGDSSFDFSSALGWGTMHGTWSVVSEDAFRVRLEVGGSMLSLPTSGSLANQPYAGDVAFGPNFGASGTVRLIGPLGVEAHARLTPVPVAVTDTGGALALRAGPLAVSGGWRWIEVAGNNTDAPQLHFSGPQVGLSFLF